MRVYYQIVEPNASGMTVPSPLQQRWAEEAIAVTDIWKPRVELAVKVSRKIGGNDRVERGGDRAGPGHGERAVGRAGELPVCG